MKSTKKDILTKMFIDSGLVEYSEFNEKDKYKLHLFLNKFDSEISNSIEFLSLSDINKFSQVIKTLIIKSKRLDSVLIENQRIASELKRLRVKFKKEISLEQQAQLNFEEGIIPLSMIHFSVRASNILAKLNINTVNDLSKLSRIQLKSLDNLGMKTFNEIIDKAAEVGVNIK